MPIHPYLRMFNSLQAQVLVHDTVTQQWQPTGNRKPLETTRVFLIHNRKHNTFAIGSGYYVEPSEFILGWITREFKYELSQDDSFFAWHDSRGYWALDWGKKSSQTEAFVEAVDKVLEILSLNLTLKGQQRAYRLYREF